jgi:hypothetical protein
MTPCRFSDLDILTGKIVEMTFQSTFHLPLALCCNLLLCHAMKRVLIGGVLAIFVFLTVFVYSLHLSYGSEGEGSSRYEEFFFANGFKRDNEKDASLVNKFVAIMYAKSKGVTFATLVTAAAAAAAASKDGDGFPDLSGETKPLPEEERKKFEQFEADFQQIGSELTAINELKAKSIKKEDFLEAEKYRAKSDEIAQKLKEKVCFDSFLC